MRRSSVTMAAVIVGSGVLLSSPPAQAGRDLHTAGGAPTGAWGPSVPFQERVASSPVVGGGYPGAHPAPGGCVEGRYDSNFSESALALRPHSEQLVGGAKAYFQKWSTFKAQHTVSFAFEKGRVSTHVVGGFDCVTTGTQDMPPSWTNVTDPNLVWDTRGRVHQLALPYNAYWGSVTKPNGNIVGLYSDDGGRSWVKGNGGAPVQSGPKRSVDSRFYLDKPWITANQNPSSPWRDHVYGVWVEFTDSAPQIHTAVSRDRGATWTAPQDVPTPTVLGSANPWPMIAVGPDGVVYLSYVTYGATRADGSVRATLWSARSTDDGRTWSANTKVSDTTTVGGSLVPGTTLHRSVVQYLAVSPDRPGHLYLAWNEMRAGQVDIRLAASTDGGLTWSAPVLVNDDSAGANQFSATVAAGPKGAVAVAFYDFRARCPTDGAAILPRNRGRAGACIGLTLQAYRDQGGILKPPGHNVMVSRQLWDPYQPGQTRDGLSQLACESPGAFCSDIFLGDYFSMQVSANNVYVLSSSTAPPSHVMGDDDDPIHYQQQVLTTVERRRLGL